MKLNHRSNWAFLGLMTWGTFAFWVMIGVVHLANSDGGSIASPWYWATIGFGVLIVLAVGGLFWGIAFFAERAIRWKYSGSLKREQSQADK